MMNRKVGLRLQRTKAKVQSFVCSSLLSGKHVGIEGIEAARILRERLVSSDPSPTGYTWDFLKDRSWIEQYA